MQKSIPIVDSKGHVLGRSMESDGSSFLDMSLLIHDKTTIEQLRTGRSLNISCGYTYELLDSNPVEMDLAKINLESITVIS